jgi:hypothetical protein
MAEVKWSLAESNPLLCAAISTDFECWLMQVAPDVVKRGAPTLKYLQTRFVNVRFQLCPSLHWMVACAVQLR